LPHHNWLPLDLHDKTGKFVNGATDTTTGLVVWVPETVSPRHIHRGRRRARSRRRNPLLWALIKQWGFANSRYRCWGCSPGGLCPPGRRGTCRARRSDLRAGRARPPGSADDPRLIGFRCGHHVPEKLGKDAWRELKKFTAILADVTVRTSDGPQNRLIIFVSKAGLSAVLNDWFTHEEIAIIKATPKAERCRDRRTRLPPLPGTAAEGAGRADRVGEWAGVDQRCVR
jgi:hypothetical protein